MEVLAWAGLAIGYGVWLVALTITVYQRPLTIEQFTEKK